MTAEFTIADFIGSLCPKCGHAKSAVLNSRPKQKWIKRRRACKVCDSRWNTIEVAIPESKKYDPLTAIKIGVKISQLSPDRQRILTDLVAQLAKNAA